MMTPLGRGGRMYSRQRRWPRVLAVVLVVVLIAAAVFGAWWWWHDLRDGEEESPGLQPATTSCRTPSPQTPKTIPTPDAVNVDVANGTDTSGLAIDTADALALEGFNVVGIGNTARPVKSGVALVRYGASGEASAIRLASYIPRAQLILLEDHRSATVQLWLGPKFDGIARGKDADIEVVELPAEDPICHKVGPKATKSN